MIKKIVVLFKEWKLRFNLGWYKKENFKIIEVSLFSFSSEDYFNILSIHIFKFSISFYLTND